MNKKPVFCRSCNCFLDGSIPEGKHQASKRICDDCEEQYYEDEDYLNMTVHREANELITGGE